MEKIIYFAIVVQAAPSLMHTVRADRAVANKQMELMARFMAELGLTPAARSRLGLVSAPATDPITRIELVTVYPDREGERKREAGVIQIGPDDCQL